MSNNTDSLAWIKKLPAWIAGAIAFVTTIVSFANLLRGNFYLGIAILGTLVLLGLLSIFIYLAFATTESVITGNPIPKYPRCRRWAIAGIVLVVIILVLIPAFKHSRLFVITALVGTPTPTQTSTAVVVTPSVDTATPLSTPASIPEFEMVSISEFRSRTISAIAQNPQNGDTWIATAGNQRPGVYRFTRDEERRAYFGQEGEGPRADVQAILGRENGEMWFATWGEGVTVLRTGAGTLSEDDDHWQTYTTSDGLLNSKVEAIGEDPRGNVWFGTRGGLCLLTPKGEWLYYHSEAGWTDDRQILPEENQLVAYAIQVDEKGDVWTATSEALLRWPAGDLEHQPIRYSRGDVLSDEGKIGLGFLISLAFDQDGKPWVGTTKGMISVLKEGVETHDEGDDEWQTYYKAQVAPKDETVFVLALLVLPGDDFVLAGTSGAGLRVWAKDTDSWIGYPELGLNVIALLMEEGGEQVWIGTDQGLFLWNIQSSP